MANYFGPPGQTALPLQQYGATLPVRKARTGHPSRLNFPAIAACLFLPWLLFCLMYATMSFSLHYTDKLTCYLCVCLGLICVAIFVLMALDSVKKQNYDPQTDSSWPVFLAAVLFLAWASGVALGDLNYYYNMEPFYDTSNLNSYPSVDPSRMPGQQVMDAGQMTFVPGSRLDFKKTMKFTNLDTYCVTPIVNGQNETQSSYDFWAVGMNCCTGVSSTFACGEFNNPNAISGLRVMRDDQRTFYRLAVKQAEAAFRIKAKHPLFFHWMQDPGAELAAYNDEGFKYYLFGVYGFFAVLLFLVIVAAIFFSSR